MVLQMVPNVKQTFYCVYRGGGGCYFMWDNLVYEMLCSDNFLIHITCYPCQLCSNRHSLMVVSCKIYIATNQAVTY